MKCLINLQRNNKYIEIGILFVVRGAGGGGGIRPLQTFQKVKKCSDIWLKRHICN